MFLKCISWRNNSTLLALLSSILLLVSLCGADSPLDEPVQIIFEQQVIEGQIRRPQLVLISVDQRPEFPSLKLFAHGESGSVSLGEDVFGELPNRSPFIFSRTDLLYPSP